ncbi:7920_t:CDS:2, partial [Funneliformis caledonium]
GETVIKLGTEHLRYIIPCVDNFHIIGCFTLAEQWKLLLYMIMMTEFIINTPTLLAQNIGSQTMKPSEGEKWSNNGVSQLKHQHYAIHNLLTYLYDVDGKNRRRVAPYSMHLVDALGVDSRMPYASITNDLAQYNKTDNL